MKKIRILIPLIVLILVLSGCTKREAKEELKGELEYMPYETVISAEFSFMIEKEKHKTISKEENENDLIKLYNVFVEAADTPYDDYDCTVYYSGAQLYGINFAVEVEKSTEYEKWMNEVVNFSWDVATGKIEIWKQAYDNPVEEYEIYIEKYIDTESADVLEEIFFKYLYE